LDASLLVRAPIALAPVLLFLTALVHGDSYKLIRLRTVLGLVAIGALAAGAAYLANLYAAAQFGGGFDAYSRYVSPWIEEALKAAVLMVLIRTRRVGLPVDAGIAGFAIGTGFAMIENLYYLESRPGLALGVHLIRGFGTAIMHGGTTAIFAVSGLAFRERRGRANLQALLPGYALAVLLHSAYNHLSQWPRVSTLAIVLLLPPLLQIVFRRSEKAVGNWLGNGFDADTEMLELINSGRLSDSPIGAYLRTLKSKFTGLAVADIICFLRLYTELSLRAKGILIMRENGFKVEIDEVTRAKFVEMRYLESTIGKTGLLAIQPMLHIKHKDLWQFYMLGK
jgi:protease PrsW